MNSDHIYIPPPMATKLVAIVECTKRINEKLDRCERLLRENGKANGLNTTHER